MADRPTTYRIVTGSANPIANSAIIAYNSITSPGQSFFVVPQQLVQKADKTGRAYTRDAAYDPSKTPGAIKASSTFTLIFAAVFVITVLSGIAQIVMAIYWEHPTSPQQEVFSAMGYAWKIGFGAIVGLLGGKVT